MTIRVDNIDVLQSRFMIFWNVSTSRGWDISDGKTVLHVENDIRIFFR